MDKLKLKWPNDFLQVQDVYLWSASLGRSSEDTTPDGIRYQAKQGVQGQGFEVEVDGGEATKMVRALVELGVRAIRPSGPDGVADQATESDVVFAIEATFAAEYLVLQEPPQEQLFEFFRRNAVHHVWPFWRAHVYDTLKRASLPVPEVPMLPPVTNSTKSLAKEGGADKPAGKKPGPGRRQQAKAAD